MRLRWHAARLILYPWVWLLLPMRVTGRKNLTRGAQILAVNHTTNVDPILIGLAAGQELHFLAKQELFNVSRIFTWLIRSWNAWPVRRSGGDPEAIRKCAWLLQHRQKVVLFPEGTRSKTGELTPFRAGIGLLSVTNRVPVVPTLTSGTSRSMISYLADRDFVKRGYRRKPTRPATIRVTFGEPVRPDDFTNDRAGQLALTAEVENRMRAMAANNA
jgi:1-acyl-sn-glycerol-3-phosphate acyltransferase